MSQRRYTANDINDDALDELYANANEGWRRSDRWKERALKAEAAVARLTGWCDELDEYMQVVVKDTTSKHPIAENVRQHLAEPEETSTK